MDDLFLRQCEKDRLPHIAALVIFMSHTAARISEALRVQWKHIDFVNRTITLERTKTGVNSVRYMTDELISRLKTLEANPDPEGFPFRIICRYNANERIKAVCGRADIEYKSCHLCGRHTFATTAIEMGIDIRTAMEAGDWKSSTVFLETYVHPRRHAGRAVADRFNSFMYEAA